MSDFQTKMHHASNSLSSGGAYSTAPDPLAVFKGPTSKWRVEQGEAGKGKESGGKGRGGWIWPTQKLLWCPLWPTAPQSPNLALSALVYFLDHCVCMCVHITNDMAVCALLT